MVSALLRPQLHDTGLLSEQHEILLLQSGFSIGNYDNITKVIINKNRKYEKFSEPDKTNTNSTTKSALRMRVTPFCLLNLLMSAFLPVISSRFPTVSYGPHLQVAL